MGWWGDATACWCHGLYTEATGQPGRAAYDVPHHAKYVKGVLLWAGFGIGKTRYIWHTPSVLHLATGSPPMLPKDESVGRPAASTPLRRPLCNTSGTLAKIARILGKTEDAAKYKELSRKRWPMPYCSVLTDGKTAKERKNSRPPMCCLCT